MVNKLPAVFIIVFASIAYKLPAAIVIVLASLPNSPPQLTFVLAAILTAISISKPISTRALFCCAVFSVAMCCSKAQLYSRGRFTSPYFGRFVS